jgi:hypothetical protein
MEAFRDDDFFPTSSVYSHEAKRHEPIDGQSEKRLEVRVIFTNAAGTLAAVQAAEGLAQQLGAHLKLLMPYEVPYALPLAEPPVPVEFLEAQLYNLAGKSGMEVEAQVCLCRDKRSVLRQLLPPNSLIVVGGKRRWWPTAAQRLSQAMQEDGHHVIFVEQR